MKLCKLYAEKDENGKPKMLESIVNGHPTKNYDISDQNVALLSKDLEDLMETEVDVEIRTVEESIIEKWTKIQRAVCEGDPCIDLYDRIMRRLPHAKNI